MSDLANLTAHDLLEMEPQPEQRAEISHRLERLERCEVEIEKLKKRIIDDDVFAASALKQAHLEIQRLAAKVKVARAALEEK